MALPAAYLARIHRALFLVGLLELVASFGIVSCGVANIIFKSRLYHIGHGIWAGIIFGLASSSAVAAGNRRGRGYLVSHLASCVVSCVFTLPGLSTLLFIEKISDTWYTYWTDSDLCRNGCFSQEGEYIRMGIGHLGGGGVDPGERFECDGEDWKSKCHPNTVAVSLEMSSLVILTMLASLFILSSSMACCILCRCRSSRDEVYPLSPADSIIVYTTYAVPNYHHAAYYNHGNINWAIPFSTANHADMTLVAPGGFPAPPPPIMPPPGQAGGGGGATAVTPPQAPPPSYDESQNEQQLRHQLLLRQTQRQSSERLEPPPDFELK